MIPIIWVAEIEFLNERIQATNEANDTSSTPKSPIPGVGSFHNKLLNIKLLLHCLISSGRCTGPGDRPRGQGFSGLPKFFFTNKHKRDKKNVVGEGERGQV